MAEEKDQAQESKSDDDDGALREEDVGPGDSLADGAIDPGDELPGGDG